jgi:hypothetical protein
VDHLAEKIVWRRGSVDLLGWAGERLVLDQFAAVLDFLRGRSAEEADLVAWNATGEHLGLGHQVALSVKALALLSVLEPEVAPDDLGLEEELD